MAITEQSTTEKGADYRGYPTNDHGKVRIQYFDLPATTVAGDDGSTVLLCDLPPGRIRVIPNLSRFDNSAFGAARTLSIGHKAYASRDQGAAANEADNPTAFANAADVSLAVVGGQPMGEALKYDIYSKGGVTVYASVAGGTIPVGATLRGFIAYVAD